MIFWRVKSLDAILATAEKKSLHRSLGPFQLTMLGIGGIIGTGIFVLTAEAAQKAGPAMMISFLLAAFVCGVAALCYAELAAMVPVSGSAYTYTYAVLGEFLAWIVGWALVLEYAVAASAVAVGWSGYIVGLLDHLLGIHVPDVIANGDGLIARMQMAIGMEATPDLLKAAEVGGIVNFPAVLIAGLVTWLLVIGTKESATVNAALVAIKLAALLLFIAFAVPLIQMDHFVPFAPLGSVGVIGAASSIFFAFVGFDAVSTAAEETKNPQRNVPIGLIGSLVICTILYMLVAAGAVGSFGAQPVMEANGAMISPGSAELAGKCASLAAAGTNPLVCSKEALAHVLRSIGHPAVGNLLGLAAGFALPSVILMMMFGQTRIFFVMSRDGLLPKRFSAVHPKYKTPHVITIVTGIAVAIAAAFFPVGKLADISNSGTLCAFFFVAIAVMILRRTEPNRRRVFRTPLVWIVAPLAAAGCLLLFFYLPPAAMIVFPVWAIIGLFIYFGYSMRRSHVGLGIVEVHEEDADAPPQPVPPIA
ncbi:amino acid permease [Flavisphingomonas formosensis]|uniref:amino acid permease n=1 Tax=Flavisphingomonas formosensis TaxID=861534 RepID=UPI0012FA5C35|nr:amino acid permease [Sphingomonas formosensis]